MVLRPGDKDSQGPGLQTLASRVPTILDRVRCGSLPPTITPPTGPLTPLKCHRQEACTHILSPWIHGFLGHACDHCQGYRPFRQTLLILVPESEFESELD